VAAGGARLDGIGQRVPPTTTTITDFATTSAEVPFRPAARTKDWYHGGGRDSSLTVRQVLFQVSLRHANRVARARHHGEGGPSIQPDTHRRDSRSLSALALLLWCGSGIITLGPQSLNPSLLNESLSHTFALQLRSTVHAEYWRHGSTQHPRNGAEAESNFTFVSFVQALSNRDDPMHARAKRITGPPTAYNPNVWHVHFLRQGFWTDGWQQGGRPVFVCYREGDPPPDIFETMLSALDAHNISCDLRQRLRRLRWPHQARPLANPTANKSALPRFGELSESVRSWFDRAYGADRKLYELKCGSVTTPHDITNE
jgi:hypothetical protein